MKLKKIIITIAVVLAFALLLPLSIYLPSKDNFSNWTNKLENKEFSLEQIEFVGWDSNTSSKENVGDYESSAGHSPSIIVRDINHYVNSLKISGYYSGKNPQVKIYYTSSPEEAFSEEKSKVISWRSTGSRIYLDDIDLEAYAIKIDMKHGAEAEKESVSFNSIETNDRSVILSINSVAKICILPTILLGIALFIALYFKSIVPYLAKFKQYIPLVTNLVSRDLKVKYRRSVLGFLWSILNPLLMALVIHTVFSRLFRFDVEYFATYYLVGSLIFNFVVECTSNALGSVIGASALIKKVYIPKYIFPLQKCVFALVNMLFGCVAVIVVMLIQGVPFKPTMLLFFVPMLYAFVFAYGFGLFLSAATVFFRDIQHLYSVFTMVWMYLTPIIYPEDMLLSNGLGIIMKLNPMYHYVHYLRSVVMYGTIPSLDENILCIVFALVMLIFGTVVFKKTQDKFILHI